jgi:membrane protease YdiL (CAAX protease family)
VKTLLLLVLVGVTLLVTAVVSPGVAGVLGGRFPLGRVFDRVFTIGVAIAIVAAWRRLDLGTARDIGFVRDGWRRWLGCGFAAGAIGVGAGLALAWIAGAAVPALRYAAGKTVTKALSGLGAAAAIGVGEEFLFRGVLLRRLRMDIGKVPGLLVTTAIYAMVHVLRSGAGGGGDWAGFARMRALFAPLADGTAVPAMLGLFGLGLLLAALRLRTGSLWPAIGVHMAWVAMFRVGRLFVALGREPAWAVGPGWPPLIGGAAGGLALVVTAFLLRRALRTGIRAG